MRFAAILYPGAISFELMHCIDLLGHTQQVDVLTPDGNPHIDASGLTIDARSSYFEAKAENYSAILIAGGNPDAIYDDTNLIRLIQTANDRQIILGGICAGVLVLAASDVLKGHSITHPYVEAYTPSEVVENTKHFWLGANYVEQGVVVSENIVTALPAAYVGFSSAVNKLLTT